MIYGVVAQEVFVFSTPPVGISGVRIDNETTSTGLTIASQTVTPAKRQITASLWFRVGTDNDLDVNFPIVLHFAKHPSGGDNFIEIGFNDKRQIWVEINNAAGTVGLEFASAIDAIATNTTHHVMVSCDTNFGAGAKLKNLYINGTAAIDGANTNDAGAAFDIGLNGAAFGLPEVSISLGSGFVIDFAEVWVGYGQYITDVTKFRNLDGTPADLGVNGATPGAQPTYYFKGGASTFATNLGTGASPSLTGSLADATL